MTNQRQSPRRSPRNGAASETRRRADDPRRAPLSEREARRFLAAIVDSSDDAIIGKDLDAIIRSWNAGAERLYGYLSAEVIGQPISLLVPPQQPDEVPRIMQQIKRGESIEHFETERMRKDGTRLYVSLTISPIRDETGAITGASTIARDITLRKRQEQHDHVLSEASRLFAASLDIETTLDSIAQLTVPRIADYCLIDFVDPGGQVRRVATVHTDPAKEALLRELARFYPPASDASYGAPSVYRDGHSALVEHIVDAHLQAAARDAEHLALLRRLNPHSAILAPLVVRERVTGVITLGISESARHYDQLDLGMSEDLAQHAALAIDNARLYAAEQQARRRAEQAAARTARLQLVTTALSKAATPAQVAAVVVDQGIQAVGAGSGAIGLLVDQGAALEIVHSAGYPPGTLDPWTRLPMDVSLPFPDAVRLNKPLFFASPQQLIARYPGLASAQIQSEAWAMIPLALEGHTLGGMFVGFASSREFPDEDRDFLLTLAHQCAQALDRAHLYRDAQEAVRLRDTFLMVAAHELKTPLTSLLGNAQLLKRRAMREGNFDPRNTRAIEVVAAQARRLDKMIMALLDISRIDQGQLSIERGAVDMGVLVRRVLDEVQPALEQHTVTCAIPDAALVVDGDELRLEQVLQNLVSNAVKYSPHGGQVDVRVERRDAQVCVSVRDQGIGIPAAAMPNLFRRFYRAGNADALHISGMGIGLYVVQEIITLHGGTVQVESQDGAGSTFTICLPLANS